MTKQNNFSEKFLLTENYTSSYRGNFRVNTKLEVFSFLRNENFLINLQTHGKNIHILAMTIQAFGSVIFFKCKLK